MTRIKDPRQQVTARYLLPVGLVELLRREAVRTACSPSVVLAELVAEGLPRRAARLVYEQVQDVIYDEKDPGRLRAPRVSESATSKDSTPSKVAHPSAASEASYGPVG